MSNPLQEEANPSRGVDTSSWFFYSNSKSSDARKTPFLVGPVVGRVTETTARILLELSLNLETVMEVFVGKVKVYSVTKAIKSQIPTVFVVEGFAAGDRVRVRVMAGFQEREAKFTAPSDKTRWKIAAVSCNCHTHMKQLGLWERLERVVGETDAVFHLGDQIYGDEDLSSKKGHSIRFVSSWAGCMMILDDKPREEWDSLRPKLLECYRETYRKTWSFAPVASVLASSANYMVCDDHEVVDDFGDEEVHNDRSSMEYYTIKVAYQVYCEYQMQLFRDVDVTDPSTKAYIWFNLSPGVGVFFSDNRVERCLHRPVDAGEEWKDKEFLGPAQWETLQNTFATEFSGCKTVLVVTPTPAVFISQRATSQAVKVIDDAIGTWGNVTFQREQENFLNLLSDWQAENPERAVVILGGDVHLGGFTTAQMDKNKPLVNQLTASAIGNVPSRDIDMVKEFIMRSAMHIDQINFDFKVRHHEWIYGPNYGVLDMEIVGSSKRPNITVTLVASEGPPKLRNLYYEEDGSAKNTHDANANPVAAVAHAAAQIQAVDPHAHVVVTEMNDGEGRVGGDGLDSSNNDRPKWLLGCSSCTIS